VILFEFQKNLRIQKLESLLHSPRWDFVIVPRTVFIQSQSVTDGQMDRRTPRRWLRSILLSRVKSIMS